MKVIKCPMCGFTWDIYTHSPLNYCPNCGYELDDEH